MPWVGLGGFQTFVNESIHNFLHVLIKYQSPTSRQWVHFIEAVLNITVCENKAGSVWVSLSLGQVLVYVGLNGSQLLHKSTPISSQNIYVVSCGSVLSTLSNISFSPQWAYGFGFTCMCFFLAPSTQRK